MTNFNQIYSFSTENLSYLYKINFQNKKVLTIGGAGDQLIEAYNLGAEHVTCLDINTNAELYVGLKTKALQVLTYNEFIHFFMPGKDRFNINIYNKVKPVLTKDIINFIDNIQLNKDINTQYENKELKLEYIPYIKNEKAYKQAQQNIKPYSWIIGNINNTHTKLINKWDIILFSNIADYSHQMYKTHNHVMQFFMNCIQPWLKNLNIDGFFMYAYIYDAFNKYDSDKRNNFNDPKIRDPIYKNIPNFASSFIQINSVIDKTTSDYALLLQRLQ